MHKRTRMIMFISLATLIIAAIAATPILKSVVEKKLRTALQQFDPYIQAGFTKAHINLFSASLQLDSLYIFYKPELKNNHKHQINFSSISINGIHFFKLITSKKFSAGTLTLKKAKVGLDNYLLTQNNSLPDSIFKKVKFPFKNIYFDDIKIPFIKIFLSGNNKLSTICTGSISLSNLQIPQIDSSFAKDSIHFTGLVCDLDNIEYPLQDYYSVQAKKFYLSSKDSLMHFDSLKLIPLLSKFQLGQRLGRQADHINASIKKIEIPGLNVAELLQKKFIARQVNINNINVHVFRDRRLPRSKQKQPMPLDYLKEITFELKV